MCFKMYLYWSLIQTYNLSLRVNKTPFYYFKSPDTAVWQWFCEHLVYPPRACWVISGQCGNIFTGGWNVRDVPDQCAQLLLLLDHQTLFPQAQPRWQGHREKALTFEDINKTSLIFLFTVLCKKLSVALNFFIVFFSVCHILLYLIEVVLINSFSDF